MSGPSPTQLLEVECSRLAEVPATPTAESGTESRSALLDNAPPGRLSNDHAANIIGNPDIRVPEMVERDDGLTVRGEEEGKDADRDVKTRSVRPEAVKEDGNTREARRTSAQAQSATKRKSEGREFHHVPGGTWLNQTPHDNTRFAGEGSHRGPARRRAARQVQYGERSEFFAAHVVKATLPDHNLCRSEISRMTEVWRPSASGEALPITPASSAGAVCLVNLPILCCDAEPEGLSLATSRVVGAP
ncbi:hypothetical protein NDU88_000277 [Pleurodeles waltl]|uniref:Uncharacterized protein n=1 Tax=Pleurodeles waltl TaxID=8319 RepID=A0AAV7MHM6_PLEWA|nr:hypothetical protein NDU88_000277 [Pleurodeles waltl]